MMMGKLLARYGEWSSRRPLLNSIITSGTLWSIGDLTAQTMTDGYPKDFYRTTRFMFYGSLIFAPLAHRFYGTLGRVFPLNTVSHVVKKLSIDQLIWAPFITSVLFTSISLMEGKTLIHAREKINDRLWDTLLVNWAVWPAVQVVNLSLIPVSYRLLIINLVSVPWSAFLAYSANSTKKSDTS